MNDLFIPYHKWKPDTYPYKSTHDRPKLYENRLFFLLISQTKPICCVMMSHTVPLTLKKAPPHSAGCHTQTQSFLRCLQTHGGTMEMQMCPFLFFPSKTLGAYCQGIQLVCHRYPARGGEAAARRSLRGHTRQTGTGWTKERDTVNMADLVWLPVHLSHSGSEAERSFC